MTNRTYCGPVLGTRPNETHRSARRPGPGTRCRLPGPARSRHRWLPLVTRQHASLSAWPAARTATAENLQEDRWTYRFNQFDIARALDNQMFWVAANQSGIFGSLKYVGDSKVVDPGGVFHLRDRRPRQGHRTRRSRHCELEGTTGSCLRTPTSRLRSSAAGRPDCRSAGTSAAKASNTSSSKPKTPVHVWTDTRWDNFTLVTPNWHCRLPGYSYAGSDPDGFKKRDEVVEWLNGWLDTFGPPACPHPGHQAAPRHRWRIRIDTRLRWSRRGDHRR